MSDNVFIMENGFVNRKFLYLKLVIMLSLHVQHWIFWPIKSYTHCAEIYTMPQMSEQSALDFVTFDRFLVCGALTKQNKIDITLFLTRALIAT